ncbi:hypothetical protein AVEN_37294-1 [Araneus ventricosus]|uniref:Uncharacterized protein n=1 Tax=Araneus ventricosus TaxID=182803 RepID=A0A4Y2QAZ5_ARAVE|nr:hypothetical protein AVEN_37294-1 [Araneus ventricosus]
MPSYPVGAWLSTAIHPPCCSFEYCFHIYTRLRWPSGKVSVLGSEGFQVRNPIPLKLRRLLGLLHAKSYVGGQTSSRWCGAEVWRWACQLRCFSTSSKLRGQSENSPHKN